MGSGKSPSPSSSNDSNPCTICLNSIHQEAYLDRCFHKFCYDCIAHWAKLISSRHHCTNVSLLCPLCKGENFSIIYDFDGHSYQQHCIVEDLGKGFALTEAHKHRLQCYYCVPGNIYNKFNILQYWKCRRYLQPNKWLQTWLRREIQALIQEEDVDVIVYHVSGIVDSFLRRNEHERFKGTPERKREEFKVLLADAARPFLTGRTERFVKEVELFLVSGLNIEAYDQVYLQCLNLDTSSDTGGTEDDIHDQMLQVPNLRLFDEDIDTTD